MKPDKLRIVPPARSAEREILADAIAAHTEARAAADKARAAAERGRGSLVAAQLKHGTAETALTAARERAIGDMTVPDGSGRTLDLRDLRRAVADARDDVDLCREALTRAEAGLVDPERAERYAREHLDETADAVLAGEIDRAEAAVDEAHRAWTCSILVAARIAAAVSPFTTSLAERNFRNRYLGHGLTWPGPISEAHDAITQAKARVVGPWEAALTALRTDPNTPLPEVP